MFVMARRSSRQLWTDKIFGRTTSSKGKESEMGGLRKPFNGRVLGIDPSLRGMGIALVEFRKGEGKLHASRTLRLKATLSMAECLGEIAKEIQVFLDMGIIDHVALEETIYVQNFKTAQILGAARGAAIASIAMRGIPVYEYPPLRIKQAVVGSGRASKEQMAKIVMHHLGRSTVLPYDESDAVGAALCHAFTWKG